jgi:hypothetical protein
MPENVPPRGVSLKLPKGLPKNVRCDEDGRPDREKVFWKIV